MRGPTACSDRFSASSLSLDTCRSAERFGFDVFFFSRFPFRFGVVVLACGVWSSSWRAASTPTTEDPVECGASALFPCSALASRGEDGLEEGGEEAAVDVVIEAVLPLGGGFSCERCRQRGRGERDEVDGNGTTCLPSVGSSVSLSLKLESEGRRRATSLFALCAFHFAEAPNRAPGRWRSWCTEGLIGDDTFSVSFFSSSPFCVEEEGGGVFRSFFLFEKNREKASPSFFFGVSALPRFPSSESGLEVGDGAAEATRSMGLPPLVEGIRLRGSGLPASSEAMVPIFSFRSAAPGRVVAILVRRVALLLVSGPTVGEERVDGVGGAHDLPGPKPDFTAGPAVEGGPLRIRHPALFLSQVDSCFLGLGGVVLATTVLCTIELTYIYILFFVCLFFGLVFSFLFRIKKWAMITTTGKKKKARGRKEKVLYFFFFFLSPWETVTVPLLCWFSLLPYRFLSLPFSVDKRGPLDNTLVV